MTRDYTLVLVCMLECEGEKCEGIFKVEGFQILEPLIQMHENGDEEFQDSVRREGRQDLLIGDEEYNENEYGGQEVMKTRKV